MIRWEVAGLGESCVGRARISVMGGQLVYRFACLCDRLVFCREGTLELVTVWNGREKMNIYIIFGRSYVGGRCVLLRLLSLSCKVKGSPVKKRYYSDTYCK